MPRKSGEAQVNRLVVEHLDLVPPIARALQRRLPHELDDLIQAGRLGLLNAARRHDGSAPFDYFAKVKIRGAILDFARMSRAYGPSHPGKNTKRPERVELPQNLIAAGSVSRLEDSLDAAQVIALGLRSLTDSEYAMVQMTYRQGLEVGESAEVLGVSGKQGSRIHKRAVEKLKKAVMKKNAPKAA